MTLDRTTSVPVSDYALQHPEHYGLRPVVWRGQHHGKPRVLVVDLCLVDREGDFVEEDGCNCDMDYACNNPTCVMEREKRPPWY